MVSRWVTARTTLDAQRERGLSEVEQVDQYPELLVRGYYGRADGAVEAFRRLSDGLDLATLNIGTANAFDLQTTKDLMRRFRPEVLRA